jgi:hypothetical protein
MNEKLKKQIAQEETQRQARATEIAHEIALESCESILDCMLEHVSIDGEDWFDLNSEISDVDSGADICARELEYLEMRGALERHIERPNLVRVEVAK